MRQTDAAKAELISPLLRIADSAGAAIMKVYAAADGVGVSCKSDGSPVTCADLAAHLALVEGLATLTPGIPVVSEEDVGSHSLRLSRRCYWIVDPLDGTKEFLARNGEFTVNIALIEDGEPTIGVVLAPALDEAYWGVPGHGAYRRRNAHVESIHVAPAPPATGAVWRVVASRSHMDEDTRAYLQRLGAHELRQAGSSLKFCCIAEGSADAYPRLGPTCEWDTAAAQAVLEAAGGVVLQMDGKPLRYGMPDFLNPEFVAASTPLALPARCS